MEKDSKPRLEWLPTETDRTKHLVSHLNFGIVSQVLSARHVFLVCVISAEHQHLYSGNCLGKAVRLTGLAGLDSGGCS